MTLEDRVLELLGRAPATWDGLRGSLGCQPGELDAAIKTLERVQSIHRERGRFYLVDAVAMAPQTAEATQTTEAIMAKKTCSKCGNEKAAEDFPKKGAQCKACLAEQAAERYREQHPKSATRSKRAKPAPMRAARHIPGTFNGSGLMVLHFEDGVRIGPITTSEAGLAQMPYHVDLSAAALEELLAWWKEQCA